MDKVNLIYIAPMGFSGSTLLDLMLNQHEEIQSVGEVMFFDEWIEKDLLCSCEKPISDCNFWNEIRRALPSGFKLMGGSKKLETLVGLISDDSDEYSNRSYKLLKQVQEYSNTKYILDSSKDMGRLEKLATSPLFNLKVIHLVRNGKDVARSGLKEKNKPSYPDDQKTKSRSVFRTAVHWVILNTRIEKVCRDYNLDCIKIRYEDLINSPQIEVNRILKFINLSKLKITEKIDNSEIHNISGSRWRYDKNLKIRKGHKKNNKLSSKDNLIFELITGYKYRQYGYTK